MTTLNQLTKHLLDTLTPTIKANDIDAWQSDGKLHITQDDRGNGIVIAKWQHSCVIVIEKLPHRKFNPYTLLVILAAWLADNEWPKEEFSLQGPEIDIEFVSKDQVQMFIQLELMEDLEIVEDPQGDIPYLGKRYRLDNIPIDWAEQVEVDVSLES